MKDNSDNRFDHFIKSKLEGDSILEEEDQWDKMEAVLVRRDFFKLAFTRFNIYYLFLLFISFSSIVYLIFSKENKSVQDKQNTSTMIEERSNASIVNDSSKLMLEQNSSSIVKNKINEPSISSNTSEKESELNFKYEESDKEMLSLATIDSSAIVKAKADTIKPVVVKKVRYVTRRDTIIQLDTSRQRKKR